MMNDDNTPKYGNTSIGTDPSLLKKIETLDIEPPKDPEKEAKMKKLQEKKKQRKNMIMIIIVIILMLGVGGGLFFYLRLGTNASVHKVGSGSGEATTEDDDIKANDIVFITGNELSKTITDYITFKKNTNKTCKLDTSLVKVDTAGSYKYYVTCDNIKYVGNVNVIDKTTVSYTTNLVYKVSSELSNVSSFISADDTTFTFNDSLPTDVGTLNPVSINAVTGKQVAYTAYGLIYVLPSSPSKYFYCSKLSGNKEYIDRFVFDENNNNLGYSLRITRFAYTDENAYYADVASIDEGALAIDDMTGYAIVNNSKKEISLVNELSSDILNEEYGSNFPTTLTDITDYYTQKGYICN